MTRKESSPVAQRDREASFGIPLKHVPAQAPPPLGHAVPHNEHHAISVQMTKWEDMKELPLRTERIEKVMLSGYPRSFLHPDVVKLNKKILAAANNGAGQSCLTFPTWNHADACLQLIRSRQPKADARVVEAKYEANGRQPEQKVYATIYHPDHHSAAFDFWRYTGTGISSRFAQSITDGTDKLTVETVSNEPETVLNTIHSVDPSAQQIRQRIAGLLQRASLDQTLSDKVTPDNVHLFPAGMSAIYHCTRMLNAWRDAQSVVFGFLYELTPRLLEIYSSSNRFFGFGTEEELQRLEQHLEDAYAAGEPVQSVWCECPSNPLLHTVDLKRVRQLADRYGFVLVVDETIGTFANIDLLSIADVMVTSLSKSFSGRADVMGGSIILNPNSPFYQQLNGIMSETYVNNLHPLDSAVLERNSRPFLARTARMNSSAAILIDLVTQHEARPESSITKVYHPSILPSGVNFTPFLRKTTSELTPSYGALFTLEFDSEKSASIFFDNLHVHKGPSLGAPVTLAQPYVQTVFAREKQWAASYGLHESIIRISVGVENPDELVKIFRDAIEIADKAKAGGVESPRADSIVDHEM